ncbi:hypothetical protein [Roseateles sp.]|uniref:hypothetical protein n=1 Tax=Roseateles sp. TaxID=1971397 RepID=UPI00286C0FC2|nr:hypothetical protein [Roseateles sp.]
MQVQAATLIATALIAPLASIGSDGSNGSEQASCLVFLGPEPVRGGCGYFDSSFELSHGLNVIEELDPVVLQLWARVLDGALAMH